jgi:4-amino-4-deoxy-L-arabinose transferase-like glycosyltransferase
MSPSLTPPRNDHDVRAHRGLLLLLVVAIVSSFFIGLGSVPLFDLDEGAFSEATREMLLRGDYVSTFLNGEPRYDKPILIYWLQAVSVIALGVNEWAFRLPSALCATVWVWFVFLFVRRLRGARPALLAAIFTATAAGITVIGRAAIADALLNMLIVAAMASAFLYLQERRRSWLHAAFLAVGFGLLAKGPVALLVPGAVTFLYALTRRDLGTWLRGMFDPVGIALLLAVAAPWYVAQYLKEGDAFVQGFLMKHNVDRFSAPMHGFRGSVFFYLPWLLVATLPFTAALLNLVRDLRSLWADDLQRFCLLWAGFVLVFFSLSGTKLPHYSFYGYTGVFVLMGLNAHRLRSAPLALIVPLALFGGLSALPWALELVAPRVRDPYYREALLGARDTFGPAYYAFSAAAALLTLAMMVGRRADVPARLAATGIVQALAIALFILPVAGEIQQSPIKEAALLARERDYDVVMSGMFTPSFIVYSGRLVARRDPRPGEVALVKLKNLREVTGYEVLYAKNGIALVRLPEAPE